MRVTFVNLPLDHQMTERGVPEVHIEGLAILKKEGEERTVLATWNDALDRWESAEADIFDGTRLWTDVFIEPEANDVAT